MRPWILLFPILASVACGHPPASEQGSESELSYFPSKSSLFAKFPLNPDLALTPGSLCQNPDDIRYPEQIPYCRRYVSKATKATIIQTYDKTLSFQVGSMDRGDFKIDHFIPLCMGGSNKNDNLWPQHRTVYTVTDKLEQRLCTALAKALITQEEAVEKIREAKRQLEKVPVIQEHCDDLLGDSVWEDEEFARPSEAI